MRPLIGLQGKFVKTATISRNDPTLTMKKKPRASNKRYNNWIKRKTQA
jgi:hypothetical protein